MMSNPAAAAAAAAAAGALSTRASQRQGRSNASWLMGCKRVNKEKVFYSVAELT